jgi:hypothetical protein
VQTNGLSTHRCNESRELRDSNVILTLGGQDDGFWRLKLHAPGDRIERLHHINGEAGPGKRERSFDGTFCTLCTCYVYTINHQAESRHLIYEFPERIQLLVFIYPRHENTYQGK